MAVLGGFVVFGGATTGYVYYNWNTLSPGNRAYIEGRTTTWQNGGVHGVPGPITGAGLPVLAVGCGAYWLVRRYRRKSDNASS
jgi:hypothetical protein